MVSGDGKEECEVHKAYREREGTAHTTKKELLSDPVGIFSKANEARNIPTPRLPRIAVVRANNPRHTHSFLEKSREIRV